MTMAELGGLTTPVRGRDHQGTIAPEGTFNMGDGFEQ
jgi:hypothetical protein